MIGWKLARYTTLATVLLLPMTASAQQRGQAGSANFNVGRGVGNVGRGAGVTGVPAGNSGVIRHDYSNNMINGRPFLNAKERQAARVANTKIPEFKTKLGAVAPVYFGGFPGYGYGYPVLVYPGYYNPYPVYGLPIYPIPPVIPTNRPVNNMGPLMEAVGQAATVRPGP